MKKRKFIDVFRPVIYEDSIEAAVKTLRSGWIGRGPKIQEFEKKFSRYIGAKYCVAVNSGTSAIHLALKCINLPEKSKIMTSPTNYVSTIHTILHEKINLKFSDIEKRTGNISVEYLKQKLTGDTRAIFCVHIGGYPCDLDELRDLADVQDVILIEDCTHAIGSIYKNRKVGTDSLCCFSFSFPKAVTGIEGGAIVTSEPEIAEKARTLRNLGTKNEKVPIGKSHRIKELGYRYYWNDVMASIALKQLDHLEQDNQRRKHIVERYLSELSDADGVHLPIYKLDRSSSYFFLPLFFEKRDRLAKKLYNHHIGSRVYFQRYDNCYNYKHKREKLPNADWYSQHELTLPINVSITDEEIDYIIKTVRKGW
jgi:dTDP-4-amino-4,6-dideoxygalactose transaminase